MVSPKWARSLGRWGGRVYEFPGIDYEFPSVTTIAGQLDKPALTNWLMDQVAYAAFDTSDWQNLDRESAAEILKAHARAGGRKAANVGTQVHAMIEEGVDPEDTLPLEDLDKLPYLVGASGEILKLGEHYASEITLVNSEQGYAGTADVLSYRTDAGHLHELRVTDWKTCKLGKSVGWREHQLQLAALAGCKHFVDPDGEMQPLPGPITELSVIGLRPDGTTDVHRMTDETKIEMLKQTFYGLLPLWTLNQTFPFLSIWEEQLPLPLEKA